MSAEAEDSVEHWRNKCNELEKVVKTLSSHCFKVVEKHEDLLGKYKTNEQQYEKLVARLKESEEQLAKMRNLVEPACTEYEVMKNKFDTELECRMQAEEYALKMAKQNKELKRQSQMLLQQRGLDITEINLDQLDPADTKDDELQKEYIKTLNDKIQKLEEENARLKAELDEVREDFSIEKDKKTTYSYENESLKAELKQTQKSLQQHRDALKRLGNASESAFQEFERLKGSYEQEVLCRDKAEKYAATLFAEREAARRQSSMLLTNVAPDKRLMEALIEVETLTTKVEEQKKQFELEMKDLQEEVERLRSREELESLEQENLQLMEQRDSLHKELAAVREQVASLQSNYKALQSEYENMEKKLKEATQPPPPPPPPPPPALKLPIIHRKKQKKEAIKKNLEKGGAAVNADYSKALEEMMKRIKEGKPLKRTLRPVDRTPSCPDESDGSAMSELKGILTKIKKSSSEGDLTAPLPVDDDSSELKQVFLRIRKPANPDQRDTENRNDAHVVLRSQQKPTPRPRGNTPLSRVSEASESDGAVFE